MISATDRAQTGFRELYLNGFRFNLRLTSPYSLVASSIYSGVCSNGQSVDVLRGQTLSNEVTSKSTDNSGSSRSFSTFR